MTMTDANKDRKKKAKKEAGPKRSERRFVPVASTNPWIVRVLGAIGGLALGAGLYAYFYATGEGHTFAKDAEENIRQIPSYLIAGGAVIVGICIWLGTSSEAPIRVGDPGIALEKGETRRMPWWAVEKITWQPGTLCLVVTGRDEVAKDWTFKVPLASHPEAIGWILREARRRIPKKVSIEKGVLAKMPDAAPHAGTKLELEPLQVVGKKCAASGQTISYEPDARVCAQCERVYFKRSVPNKCKCGAAIGHLRPATVPVPEDVEEEEEQEEEPHGDEADETDEASAEEEETTSEKQRAAEDAETS